MTIDAVSATAAKASTSEKPARSAFRAAHFAASLRKRIVSISIVAPNGDLTKSAMLRGVHDVPPLAAVVETGAESMRHS